MVWHHGLIQKLKKIGLKGQIINYIQDFLNERKITVGIDQALSDQCPLENGTPQGSILSPTLFNIMINDLFEGLSPKINTSKFADDGALWIRTKSIVTSQNLLQKSLNKIQQWADKWGFSLNSEKTTGIVFKHKNMKQATLNLQLNNKPIKFQKQTKFLGLIFDEHLSWDAHVKNLTTKCSKDLNTLRCLTGSNWGASKDTLLSLYTSLIRSKLDYGCAIYDTLNQTLTKKLDSIQYQALKLVTRTQHGTSLTSLQALTGEMPLNLRRQHLTLNFWAASQSNPLIQNIISQNIHPRNQALTRKHPLLTPISQRIINYLNEHQINNQKQNCKQSNIFTPKLKIPQIDTSLANSINKQTDPNIAKSTTLAYIHENWPNWCHIYTDGSSDPISNRTGFGVHIAQPTRNTQSFRLPNNQSIFTAELMGMASALHNQQAKKQNKILILTDSLSGLQALQNKNTKNRPKLINQILKSANNLTDAGKQIVFVWIPAHVGIYGNENADQAAKQSLKIPEVSLKLPISKSEIKSINKRKITQKWHNLYLTTNTQIQKVLKKPLTKPKILHPSKKIDRIITKLQTGHTKLNSHLQKIKKHATGKCPHCSHLETIEHALIHCTHYQTHRTILQTNLNLNKPLTLEAILNPQNNIEKFKALGVYLTKTELINRIYLQTNHQSHHINQ